MNPEDCATPSCSTGKEHGSISCQSQNHPHEPMRSAHVQNNDHNLHLVHLLTTNPAAALPAIFPSSGNCARPYPRQVFRVARPHRLSNTSNVGCRAIPERYMSREQFLANSWEASVMNDLAPAARRRRCFSELYASKEDMDKIACCTDNDGNFNFEALLPAVYWKEGDI